MIRLHNNDVSLYTLFRGDQFKTWNNHLTFHETCSQDTATESNSSSYDAYLIELGIFEGANAAVVNSTVSITSEADINQSNIVGSKQCLVHIPTVNIEIQLCKDIASQNQPTTALKKQGQDLHDKQKSNHTSN